MFAVLALALAGEFTVVRSTLERPLSALERSTSEARPPLRGFFPPLGQGIDAPGAVRSDAWDPPRDELGSRAAQLVGTHLARDGFVATLAQVVELAGPATFAQDARIDWLASVGFPIDWAASFRHDGDVNLALSTWIARDLAAGTPRDQLAARVRFAFTPSLAGFAAASESGEHPIACLRMHVARPRYWTGPGDGSALDVFRQLAEDRRELPIRAVIDAANVDELVALAKGWNVPKPERVRLLVQDLPVSQWAQDNGKSGFANGALATLAPRFVSRGEEASAWVAGDARALETFAADGVRVVRSPLAFQGGNALVVHDPKRDERVLLLGEAEVERNHVLGLAREDVIAAFRAEFGVARVLVLPALSYHVDYEVSARAIGGELVCFVNDEPAAAFLVARACVDVLERAHTLDEATVRAVRDAIEARDGAALVAHLAPPLYERSLGAGRFPESFARPFSLGAADSHVANFERLLLAIDVLAARAGVVPQGDAYFAAYLAALARTSRERVELSQLLASQGWKVVAVPGLAAGERGVTYLNAVHARGLVLLPAWGGLLAPLDAAARAVFERAAGQGVSVVSILSAESQRRQGALHCSVEVLPGAR